MENYRESSGKIDRMITRISGPPDRTQADSTRFSHLKTRIPNPLVT